MGQISSLFAHKVVDAAIAFGGGDQDRRRALLALVDLDPDAPIDPKRMVGDARYYALCERIAQSDAARCALPVRIGASMRCDDYGAFGLAWKSALDLRGSFRRAERFGRVLTSVSAYTLEDAANGWLFRLHRAGDRRLGLRMSNEQTLVAVVQISREVCGEAFTPETVFFQHPAPRDTSTYEAFFRCPVRFDADIDALAASPTALATPNKLGDRGLSAFFDAHLDRELAELRADDDLERRIRAQIMETLSEGAPSIADVARRLAMSPRTLQRRLSARGIAFQDLRDGARRDLAERLLSRTQYGLSEVAFLTGFSEQSALTRAFKRWHGRTPAAFRQAARG